MTDPIIRSKRSRGLVAFLFGIFFTMPAFASNLPKIPVIHQVGILPVQLEAEGESYDLKQIQEKLDRIFPKVGRDAKRFRVLNDDLIRGLWNTPAGRDELRSQFELHAYLSLSLVPRDDTVTIGCRLLGADLQNYMLETELYQRSWLMNAPAEAVRVKLEELVFRLINRIPIDVSVTSVQGPYITLSGGEEQGIETGDRVSLIRSSVRSLHPANGTWLAFKNEPLGEAKIVEVKSHSSVAKLVKLTFEGALQVGDGAKIPAIAGRVKFARMGKKSTFADSGNQDTILVPPLYQGDPPKPNNDVKIETPIGPDIKIDVPDKNEMQDEVAAAEPSDDSPPPANPTEPEDEGSVWDDFEFSGGSSKLIDDLIIAVGPHWWSSVGRSGANASGKFPLWLLNHIEVSVARALFYNIRVGFGGGGTFGSTANGRYFGYDSHAKIYWHDELMPGTAFAWWEAGGLGKFSGMSVEDETFGGGDFIRGGGFGAVGGRLALGVGADPYDWFSEFSILPLNIGRFGYNEKQHTVESTFGWQFTLGGYQASPGNFEYGARFRMFSETMTLSDNSRPQLNDFYLEALLRIRL